MKKLLSVILAITMIISLIPAAVAAGETDTTENLKIVYDIGAQMKTYHPVNRFTDLNYTMTMDFWEAVAYRNGDSTSRLRNLTDSVKNISYMVLNSTRTWYAFKIKVPVTGNYVFSMDIYENHALQSSSVTRVALLPASTELVTNKDYGNNGFAAFTGAVKLCDLSNSARIANCGDVCTYTGNSVPITAGEHIVVILNETKNETTNLVSFTLTSGTGETAPMIKAYSEPTDIAIGGETID